jgi:hypothetical protein
MMGDTTVTTLVLGLTGFFIRGTKRPMSQLKFLSRAGLSALSAGRLFALLGVIVGPAHPTQAAV